MRTVFISYSQDSDEHRVRVLALADRLNREGFDCTIDQYEPHPREPWPRWMDRQIETAQFVLVVCTERYLARAEGREAPGVGHGVTFESVLIFQDLYDAAMWNDKFIPVVLRNEDSEFVPKPLRGYTRYRLYDDREYPKLRDVLAGRAGAVKPLADSRPEPSATAAPSAGPSKPELERALGDARQRERDRLLAGADVQDVRAEILDIKRAHRNRDRLRQGVTLGDRYLLDERIGKGNFGTIWKAFDERDRRVVAVKVLHEHHHDDNTRIERFNRGARKMAGIRHPGIVQVFDQGSDDDELRYFVMEYVNGPDLHRAVVEKQLAAEQIFPMIRQVAAALQHAHDQGVVHRDIKPANILLDAKLHPKLTDFDLVRDPETTGGTQWGGMFGTVRYSAPEAIEDPEHAGPPADVYSLAMTLAFCLHGKEVPYLRDVAPFLDRLPCPPGVRAALRKGTGWDTAERFQSVAVLMEAIERGLTAPPEAKTPAPSRPRPTAKPRSTDSGQTLLYLEKQVASLPEADRSAAVLTAIERALPIAGDDLKTLGLVAWALDYFPGRSARVGDQESAAALRNRAFAPLRESAPPPPLPRSDDPAWAWIPGGSFQMGSPPGKGFGDEQPLHQVAISPFRLGIYPVTATEFARLSGMSGKSAKLPATAVDWYAAYAYAAWLGGRLPTEAEWEYAARGGSEYEYADRQGRETTLEKVGWFTGNAKSVVHPVGGLEPNPWGLYDLIGNVWEWTADWYGPYPAGSQSDPCGPASGVGRVVRGGSAWGDAGGARAGYRVNWLPEFVFGLLSFRVALPAVPELSV